MQGVDVTPATVPATTPATQPAPTTAATADTQPATSPTATSVEEAPPPEAVPPPEPPHPVPPAATAAWPARLLWSIGGLFAAAALLGPVVARRRPAEPPEFDGLGDDTH